MLFRCHQNDTMRMDLFGYARNGLACNGLYYGEEFDNISKIIRLCSPRSCRSQQ